MIRLSLLGLGAALLGLSGCGSTCESGDTACGDTSDTNDTNDTSFSANANWSGTGVVVQIKNGTDTAGYDFGMAQTGVTDNGWGGEDCLSEVPAGFSNVVDSSQTSIDNGNPDHQYQFCHHLTQTGGTLDTVASADLIVDGASTIMSEGIKDTITYVLFESSSSACWSWGDDTSYYGAYTCTEV